MDDQRANGKPRSDSSQADDEPSTEQEPEFKRFEDLLAGVLKIPKSELDEKRQKALGAASQLGVSKPPSRRRP